MKKLLFISLLFISIDSFSQNVTKVKALGKFLVEYTFDSTRNIGTIGGEYVYDAVIKVYEWDGLRKKNVGETVGNYYASIEPGGVIRNTVRKNGSFRKNVKLRRHA